MPAPVGVPKHEEGFHAPIGATATIRATETFMKRAAEDVSPVTQSKRVVAPAKPKAMTEKVAILDAGAQYGKVRARHPTAEFFPAVFFFCTLIVSLSSLLQVIDRRVRELSAAT